MSHPPMETLIKQRDRLTKKLPAGSAWQHYKNRHFYIVENLSLREDADTWSVNYRDEISGVTFNRLAETFLENVKNADGETVARFSKVKEERRNDETK